MEKFYIQGSGSWPFNLDTLSISGELFPDPTDSNLYVGYFGFPTSLEEKGYFFRIWQGLNTNLNIWYGENNFDGIADLRGPYLINFGISANSQTTAKITFNKNTKTYTRAGTPSTQSVHFISNNSAIMGSTPSTQNSATLNLNYNGWIWEKDFTFNTTSTINYKIVLGGSNQYGDNNQDGIASLGENFIPLNVVAGNTYRFRAKTFTFDFSTTSFVYEVICLTCIQKQNQIISTPFNVYRKTIRSTPFNLNATINSNLQLYYTSNSSLFTVNENGLVTLGESTGIGDILIYQPGDNQWNPTSKTVSLNIENNSQSCLDECLNTGILYFNNDTYIKLYNETGSGLFFSNEETNINRFLLESNESWLSHYSSFTGYKLSGYDNNSAGIILKINDSTRINNQNKFHINYGINNTNLVTGNYYKQLIQIRPQKPKNIGYDSYFQNDTAWASYDVSTGMMIPNKVFSYAINIVASGTFSGYSYYTGNINVDTETGRAFISNSQKSPELFTGIDSILGFLSFDNYKSLCEKIAPCQTDSVENEEICYSGNLTDTFSLQAFLSGISQRARSGEVIIPEKENNILNSVEAPGIKYSTAILTGYILYNNWISGDSITWSLYNFDYSGLYRNYHLNNDPIYPTTGFTLRYPNDWNSLDSLVTKLNEKINSLISYPVWYPYECLSGLESGVYITGKLIEFKKNIQPTGEIPINHFNNRIDFVSNRAYPQIEGFESYFSYGLSFSLSQRPPEANLLNGFNYLIPDIIKLEGFNKNTQNWDILDQKTNLYESFKNVERILKPIPLKFKPEEFIKEEEEEQLPEEEFPTGLLCRDQIASEPVRVVIYNNNPLCPPEIKTKNIIVTAPNQSCQKYTIGPNGEQIPKFTAEQLCQAGPPQGGEGEGGGDNLAEDEKPIGNLHIIRTGWNLSQELFNNSNEYSKYKISLYNFSGIFNENLLQKRSFFVENVNLYSVKPIDFTVHTADPICTINADYTIDVQGIVPIEISGIFNYTLIPEESGIYRFFNTPFVRAIQNNERTIKFNKVTGQITSISGTGYLTTSGYGTKVMTYQNNDYYFYNPSTQLLSFSKTLSGLLTGFGILSGETTVIKQDVINRELLFGGRLNNIPPVYDERISNGTFNTKLDNILYIDYDVTGFYPITGKVTGNTSNGRLQINNNVVVTGITVGDIYPYYPIPTGFTISNVLFNINYNSLINFETISINNNTLIYHSNASEYPPPTYFNSNNSLVSIINDSPNIFICSGEINGSNIKLTSTLQGQSGNINLNGPSGKIQIIQFNSGINIYPRLYNFDYIDNNGTIVRINKDPLITGNIADIILGTGFYYNNQGSGNITGNVQTFTGVRTFFDVWDIASGNLRRNYLSFLQNNFISGTSFYRNSNFGRSPTNVNLRVFYLNYLNTLSTEDPDIVDLIVDDFNNPNLPISGIIFRLSGIK